MNNLDREVGLSPSKRAMLGAIRTGRKDAGLYLPCDPGAYGARESSAWAAWYRWGFDGLGVPEELQGIGIEL